MTGQMNTPAGRAEPNFARAPSLRMSARSRATASPGADQLPFAVTIR